MKSLGKELSFESRTMRNFNVKARKCVSQMNTEQRYKIKCVSASPEENREEKNR